MNAAERALWDLVQAKAPLEVCGVVYVPAARIAELEAQLAAARAALAACREVAGKRAGR